MALSHVSGNFFFEVARQRMKSMTKCQKENCSIGDCRWRHLHSSHSLLHISLSSPLSLPLSLDLARIFLLLLLRASIRDSQAAVSIAGVIRMHRGSLSVFCFRCLVIAQMFSTLSSTISSNSVVLALAIVMGMYFVSSVILLRMNIPQSYLFERSFDSPIREILLDSQRYGVGNAGLDPV